MFPGVEEMESRHGGQDISKQVYFKGGGWVGGWVGGQWLLLKGEWITEKEQGTSDRFEPKSYTLNFTLSRLGLRFMEMHRLTPRLAIPPISGLGGLLFLSLDTAPTRQIRPLIVAP